MSGIFSETHIIIMLLNNSQLFYYDFVVRSQMVELIF